MYCFNWVKCFIKSKIQFQEVFFFFFSSDIFGNSFVDSSNYTSVPLKISWPVCCGGSSLRRLVFHAVISLEIYTRYLNPKLVQN